MKTFAKKLYYRPSYWPTQSYQDILIECRDNDDKPLEARIEMHGLHDGEVSACLCIFTENLIILPLLHAVMLMLPDPTTENEIIEALESVGFTDAKESK
jgi:hypothetical protein